MVSIPVIAHFAAATFFGNVAFSAMGFGMAICYLFVYQIGALSGLVECCGLPGLKYAVFIQTIGMAVIQPIVLWNVGLKKNFRLDLMLTMLPMQFIGAPIGQFLQVYTPAEILKIVVGVATIAVAGWQIFNIIKTILAARSSSYKMVEDDGAAKPDAEEGFNKKEEQNGVKHSKLENGVKHYRLANGYEEGDTVMIPIVMGNGVENSKLEDGLKHYKIANGFNKEIMQTGDRHKGEDVNMILEKYTTDTVMIPIVMGNGVEQSKLENGVKHYKIDNGLEHPKLSDGCYLDEIMQIGYKQEKDLKHKIKTACRNIIKQLWPIRPVIIWMSLAGLVSGFLGGLIGVRSPPLIIFFFLYEFPPLEVKANGAVIATANTLVRIIMYITNPPPASYGSSSWFVKEDIYLYLTVAVVAVTASPIGLYFTKYLNKKGYKVALTVLLIVNGGTMITTAVMDLI